MDSTVAEGFAHGHRGIRVPDPVIASAWVPKASIFALFSDRSESEALVDPARVVDLQVRDYDPGSSDAATDLT